MTNYTILESRSTAMPIAHPKLKRENKTDRSTKPCSNCGRLDGRPDRPLAVSVLSDLVSRVTDAVLPAQATLSSNMPTQGLAPVAAI